MKLFNENKVKKKITWEEAGGRESGESGERLVLGKWSTDLKVTPSPLLIGAGSKQVQ